MTLEDLGFLLDASGKSPAYYLPAGKAVDPAALDALKAAVGPEPGSAARICLHAGPVAAAQDMIVALRRGGKARPHRHASREETYHLVEGRLRLRFYDDAGAETGFCDLGGPGTGLPLFFRMPARTWHITEPQTDLALFHESRPGPFDPSDTTVQ